MYLSESVRGGARSAGRIRRDHNARSDRSRSAIRSSSPSSPRRQESPLTMLTGIKKIQGLGVFGNFVATNDLPDFARFNIIYGENGSGKTTLSRLFGALVSGEHTEYPDLEFTIS